MVKHWLFRLKFFLIAQWRAGDCGKACSFLEDLRMRNGTFTHRFIGLVTGVALFAGYQIGEFKSLKEIKDIWQKDRAFSPKIKNSLRNKLLQGWKLAIKKTLA